MTECGAPECENGGPHLCVGYDLNPEDVREAMAPAIVPELSKDQVLAFLVKNEDAAQHGSCLRRGVASLRTRED